MSNNKIEKIITDCVCGCIVVCHLPCALFKSAMDKVKNRKKENNGLPVEEIKVDINRLDKGTQDAIKRMYAKKNGIPV